MRRPERPALGSGTHHRFEQKNGETSEDAFPAEKIGNLPQVAKLVHKDLHNEFTGHDAHGLIHSLEFSGGISFLTRQRLDKFSQIIATARPN